MLIQSGRSIILFKHSTWVLVYLFYNYWETEVWKSQTMIVDPFLAPHDSVNICFMHFDALLLVAYMSFWWIDHFIIKKYLPLPPVIHFVLKSLILTWPHQPSYSWSWHKVVGTSKMGSTNPHFKYSCCCLILSPHKRRLYTWTSPDGWHRNQINYILCSQRWRSSIQSAKTKLGADYGSDHELLIVTFRLKMKKVEKTARPFRYNLNQIPDNYTVEVRNRFKGLDLIDRVPDELWTEVHDIV